MAPYNYNGREPNKISVDQLTAAQHDLIFENPSFCMLPWVHLHAFPTGEAYPCCNSEMTEIVGNTRDNSLEEIWNAEPMRALRRRMLAGERIHGCTRCYEQEDMGFFSMRRSSNKHFGHHIALTDLTEQDGRLADMRLVYWDIRFSNLCNLRCRSCGHIFSSNWYDDQVSMVKEAGYDADAWRKQNARINFAGRNEDDIWQQLEPKIPDLEQVYFAGGEPLIMEEHYRLLRRLLDQGLTHVRLIYNTNFSTMSYKKSNVLEMWREFESVSVGASLDAMGPKAEYIRHGTKWADVERNREEMMLICPRVDFYISPTLSILNAHHLPEFHRNWVARGFIRPPDLNVNILQVPEHYRIDVLPHQHKVDVQESYLEHLEWLRPHDGLTRATVGFESAIKFMMGDDKSALIPKFLEKTAQIDRFRGEDFATTFPELRGLHETAS